MTRHIVNIGMLAWLLVGSLVTASWSDEIRLFAAASLTDVTDQLAKQIASSDQLTLMLNRGSSGILAKQIYHGAPADLYISANYKWIDYLLTNKKISEQTVMPLMSNQLVVVANRQAPIKQFSEIINLDKVAIGQPEHVPAGDYAVQVLQRSGLWSVMEEKLVLAKDVRHALQLVVQGVVSAALVYRSDTFNLPDRYSVITIDAAWQVPVTYYLAITPQGLANPACQKLMKKIKTGQLDQLWQQHGFEPLSESR